MYLTVSSAISPFLGNNARFAALLAKISIFSAMRRKKKERISAKLHWLQNMVANAGAVAIAITYLHCL
ncbi:MAG: hypothetical protein Q8912_14755, partial [Bacillota bacterium]|nr:hypothetical protein [Bacillota bacterium]